MEAFQAMVKKWWTPTVMIAVVTSIVGGIIWGNNLTEEAITAAKERGEIIAQQRIMLDKDQDTALLLSRTAAVQESLIFQLDRLEQRMTRNEGLIYKNQDSHGSK